MPQSKNSPYYLAVDIGASSGRHILGRVEDGRMVLEEVYRFENTQIRRNGHDCWDVQALYTHLLAGLRACAAAGKIPVTMGVDTWAVDYQLLDARGAPVGDAVAYRDARTRGADALVERVVPFQRLYARTGIQKQVFNTVYQLAAQREEHPEELEGARHLLMMPELLHYWLTGVMMNEYTNATTTALVNARTKTWDTELLDALGLPQGLFGPLHLPGETVGRFTPQVRREVGFDCTVVLPATHDTGSAFLAVPVRDDGAVTLSSGTWSLLGVENREPITTLESLRENFTNEGGYLYRYRFLKNIMGLWMHQSIRRELCGAAYVRGKGSPGEGGAREEWSFARLETAAREAAGFPSVVDVNDPDFLSPQSMISAVKAACARSGQRVPETVGEVMQCVYQSLAESYARAAASLSRLTGRRFTRIHIVGGGSRDDYLGALTAKAAGLPVYTGPTEGTALGNLMVQMLAAGAYPDLAAARAAIEQSFEIKEILP